MTTPTKEHAVELLEKLMERRADSEDVLRAITVATRLLTEQCESSAAALARLLDFVESTHE